jgi:cytoskeletal protein CcmA (bactofilin family)
MAKNSNEIPSALAAETIVGHSVRIEGDLVSEGDIKVDGVVSGKVRTSQNLFVGPTAKIEADVEAGSATVAGVIEGNIKVKGLIVILQTGHVVGDIDCRQLAVEEGAYFAGNCKMAENQKDKTLKAPIDEE